VNKQLALVRSCREARRDAAAQRLAAAQRAALAAQGRAEQRSTELRQAFDDVLLLRSDRSATLDAQRRASVAPGVQALFELAERAAQHASIETETARHEAAECRKALVSCERSLLRNDELLGVLKTQMQVRARLGEQMQDDEVAITRRHAKQSRPWS
jgi:hypothetical protein